MALPCQSPWPIPWVPGSFLGPPGGTACHSGAGRVTTRYTPGEMGWNPFESPYPPGETGCLIYSWPRNKPLNVRFVIDLGGGATLASLMCVLKGSLLNYIYIHSLLNNDLLCRWNSCLLSLCSQPKLGEERVYNWEPCLYWGSLARCTLQDCPSQAFLRAFLWAWILDNLGFARECVEKKDYIPKISEANQGKRRHVLCTVKQTN